MDLNTITDILRPTAPGDVTTWTEGHAWLAGGTWLFSEPQPGLDTLIDLRGLNWPSLAATPDGLEIAATCRIIELSRFQPPPEWTAGPMLGECCRSLLASFKIWNAATVGGNICMSLPAGALIAMAVGLEATVTLLPRDGEPRRVAAVDFVTGNHANVLRPGELLRSITIPVAALRKRFALRRATLTHLGRSAALIVGTRAPGADDLLLTVTAATPQPIQMRFATMPTAEALAAEIAARVPEDGYFDDVNGTPAYKRHLTYRFCEQIRTELAAPGAPA